ncbi:MAG: choline dehydrogenase-like flavoprotein/pimeloyl-ACP methyl ester carboxylesterase [Arenicella sp.]|jgi:choline dehydrogenase-like flavoprotein/pimeloyl-ACP methyl ester carboxylesterase
MGKNGSIKSSSQANATETGLPSKAWLANGVELLFQRKGLNKHGKPFDVVIVGSGYGGSIAAAELSKATRLGLSICLLERGREFLPGSFPNSMDEALTEFRATSSGKPIGNLEGLYDIRINKDLNIMQANGLGGGSLINAGVMARANNDVFEGSRWPAAINASGLEQHYDQAELLLGSKNLDSTGAAQNNTIFAHPNFFGTDVGPAKYQSLKTLAQGATSKKKTSPLGSLNSEFRNANITVNMSQGQTTSAGIALNLCNLCGDCASGCNNNAKISLDKNLLVEAAGNGVEIFTGATVLSLLQNDSEGWQLEVVYTDAQLRMRQSEATLSLDTSNIILSAGALGSTEILERSQTMQLPFSHRLGKQFSSNGDMLAVGFEQNQLANAIADPTIAHSKRSIGPTITGMIDSRNHTDASQRMVIQEMAVPAPAAHFFGELYATVNSAQTIWNSDKSAHRTGSDFADPAALNQKALNYTSLYAVMGDDGANGSLVLENPDYQDHEGTIKVKWPQLKEYPLFDHQIDRLKKLSGSDKSRTSTSTLGGHVLPNPVWQLLKPEHMNMMKVDRGAPLTVHPLGGCPMGESEKDGATNHLGQVFKPNNSNDSIDVYAGLTVLDGAIIPEAVGINPALTISAISLRAIREQIRLNYFSISKSIPMPTTGDSTTAWFDSRRTEQHELPIIRSLKNLEKLATDTQKTTEIQVTERLVGFSQIEDNAGEWQDVVIELTLWSKPVGVKSLINQGSENQSERSCLIIDDAKQDPVSGQPLSKVRLYHRNDWDDIRSGKTTVDKHEIALDNAAQFIGQINGTLEVFVRAESYPLARIIESGWGWFLNRGLRDLYQFSRPEYWEKPAKAARPGATKKRNVASRFFNLARSLSRAGEIRTLCYCLTVTRSLKSLDFSYFGPSQEPSESRAKKRIVGIKRLTYQRRANPWTQLSEVSLQQIPSNADDKLISQRKNTSELNSLEYDCQRLAKQQRKLARHGNTLALDMNYLTKAGIPLIRITQQQNQVKALMDLSSFGTYATRMLLGVHFYSFRAPDAPRPRKATRLAGKIQGLPMPTVQRILVGRIPDDSISTLIKGQCVEIVVTHFAHQRASKPPVVLLHGYSGSSAFFAHSSTPNSLAKFMHEDQRDVWLVDLRTSSALASARYPWTFETVSSIDIPRAISHIYDHYHGEHKLDLIAHCMGSVMLGMSILRADDLFDNGADRFFKDRINRIVLSQATPTVVFTEDNNFRSFVTNYVRELVPDDYQFQIKEGEKASQMLDRILYTLPYPRPEYDLVNAPLRPSRRAEFARTRHRVDAFFSRTFELANLSSETLDHIDDFFGPIHVDTILQASRFSNHNVATNSRGRNQYVSQERLQRFWAGIPTMSFHSRNNGLIDYSTGERTKRVFQAAGVAYKSVVIGDQNYGHQDSILGVRAYLDVFPHISAFLDAADPCGKHNNSTEKTETVYTRQSWVVEAPVYGPIIIDQDHRSKDDNVCKIMLGSSAARAAHPYCIFVPVVLGQTTLRLAGSDATQQSQILERYIAQSLKISNTSSDQQTSRWHIVNLPNSMLLAKQSTDLASTDFTSTVSAQHHGDETYGLAALMIYRDLVELDGNLVISEIGQQANGCGSHQPNNSHQSDDPRDLNSIIRHTIQDFIKSNRNVKHEFEKSVIEYRGSLKRRGESISFAVGSCQYPAGILDEHVAYRSYQQLNKLLESRQTQTSELKSELRPELRPEFVALLGDQIYADATAGFLDPSTRFDQFVIPYFRLYENPHVRSVLRKLPLYAMLDDHELCDNWEPVINNPNRQLELDNTLKNGVSSFLTFQRGHLNHQKVLGDKAAHPPLWYSFKRSGYDFFMCDTRTERSARTSSNILDQGTTIMRATQQAAIESWLLASDKNQAKFILSSSIVLPRHRLNHASQDSAANCIRSDGWDGYPVSLYKMLAMVVDQGIEKLVFVSGDEHIGCYADIQIANLSSGQTAEATSIHCPGLYSPFPFANGRVDGFEGDLQSSPETDSAQLQEGYISEFRFEHSGMKYQCTVKARFEMSGKMMSIGPIQVELCEGFLIVNTL